MKLKSQPEPCTERYDGQQLRPSRAGVVRHGGRIIDFFFTVVSPAVLFTLGFMQYFGATDRRELAGRGNSSSRGWRGSGREAALAAGEMVVAVLAVTSGGGWAAEGEGRYVWTVYEMACLLFHVQWTSSSDHAATTSAVLLHRSSSSTSAWCLSFSSSTECFFLVVNRDRYSQFLVVFPGLWGHFSDKVVDVPVVTGFGLLCEARGRISHIFYVLAPFARNLDVISTSSLYLAATCPCALRQPTETFG